jgi:voltage-gated sodium channel
MKRLEEIIVAERAVIAVIVVNTIALMAMGYTDPETGTVDGPSGALYFSIAQTVDQICVVYFILETTLKVRSGGWKRYWSVGWNRFDFIIVVMSAPVLLTSVLPVRHLSVLLAFRLGRMFRLFRAMRFIPNREHLWLGAQRALKASIGIFLALCIVNVVLSIGATQLFGRIAPEFFGDPATASYTMFRVFSIEGWYEIPDLIASRVDHPALAVLARLYFVASLMTGGFVLVGLANAVFVDEMTMDNNQGLEDKIDALHEELRALRKQLDAR